LKREENVFPAALRSIMDQFVLDQRTRVARLVRIDSHLCAPVLILILRPFLELSTGRSGYEGACVHGTVLIHRSRLRVWADHAHPAVDDRADTSSTGRVSGCLAARGGDLGKRHSLPHRRPPQEIHHISRSTTGFSRRPRGRGDPLSMARVSPEGAA